MDAQKTTIKDLQQRVATSEMQNDSLKRQLKQSQAEYEKLQQLVFKNQEFDDLLRRFDKQELQAMHALQERTETANKLEAQEKKLKIKDDLVAKLRRDLQEYDKKGIEQNAEIARLRETASDWQKKCLTERQERSADRLSGDHT